MGKEEEVEERREGKTRGKRRGSNAGWSWCRAASAAIGAQDAQRPASHQDRPPAVLPRERRASSLSTMLTPASTDGHGPADRAPNQPQSGPKAMRNAAERRKQNGPQTKAALSKTTQNQGMTEQNGPISMKNAANITYSI